MEKRDDATLLAHITDDLPVGVWVARAPGGEFLYANKEFAEIMGMNARADVVVGEYAQPYGIYAKNGQLYPESEMPFVRAIRERTVVTVDDLVIHRRDGSKVHVRAQARPVFDETGATITHVVIAFIDISREALAERARAESEARLQEAQKMESIGRLAGGIAHDFNNLLSIVLGNISVLGLSLPAHSGAQLALDDATLAVRKAAELTNQLLAYAGRATRDVRTIDLSKHVREISELLATSISRKVDLHLNLAADLPPIEADATQMQQVVMNLAINAAEAIGDAAGRIEITTELRTLDALSASALVVPGELPLGQHVVLSVRDTGSGMDDATRAQVFEPFFSTKLAGRGLGLAMTLGIVKTHKGAVEIASKLGEGTTFRVFFPASSRPLERPSAKIARASQRAGLVLIVDDEPAVRRAFERILTAIGYDVIEAADGLEAIERFSVRKDDITVVLLDMTMPRLGGEETFRELRRHRPNVPIVVTSGHSELDLRQRLGGEPFLAILPKPFTGNDLERSLAKARSA